MKISLDFAEFTKVLGYINTVLSDKSVEEKVKNVIFLVTESDVTLVGYNPITFCKTGLDLDKISIEGVSEKGWEFQIRANELNKIVSSYSSLFKTKVDGIDIEDNNFGTKITVHEKPIDEEKDARLAQDSVYEVENAPIMSKIINDITTGFPAGGDWVASSDLLVYLSSLLPLMSNDSANSTASKLHFAEDYVFTMSSSTSAFFKNNLTKEFKGITLGYSSVSFIKKLCESSDMIMVARDNLHLCLMAGNTEAYIRYKPIKINYKVYIDKKSKDKGISVDRLYMKDVLKRMGSMSVDGKMIVSDGENLTVMNELFQQEVPLIKCKEGTVGISFKISIPILSSLMLGDEAFLKSELFIYFVETSRSYIIYIQDSSGIWFTSTQVSKLSK